MRVVFQLLLDDGEGFDQTGDVLVRLDAPGIQHERVSDLVTVEDHRAFRVLDRLGDTGVNGVRDDCQLYLVEPQVFDRIPLGRF